MVHHAQLVDLVLSEHVLATCVLLGQGFRLLLNCLLQKDIHNLRLRLLLQEVVSIIFLLLEMERNLLDVLGC